MNILIDGRAFSLQRKGGVSQLWAKLIPFLGDYYQHTYLLLYKDWNYNIHLLEALSKQNKIKIIEYKHPPSDNFNFNSPEERNKLNEFILKSIDTENITLVNTYYGHKVFYNASNYIVVAHDFAHEELSILQNKPSTSHVISLKREAFSEADKIICISTNTYRKLKSLYKTKNFSKIRVIYHGHDDNYILQYNKKTPNSLIHIGTRSGYKNFRTVAEGIRLILNEKQNITVYIVGGEPFSEVEQKLKLEFEKNIHLVQEPTDQEIDQLISKCSSFISGSKYEGFGIPVLNAMRLSTTPVLSDIDIYREIAGSNAVYFDPDSPTDIRNAIALSFTKKQTAHVFRPWKRVADEYIDFIGG